jgi:triosephosphate isomerase
MTQNKNIIIANWKMNHSFDATEEWLKSFNKEIEGNNNLPEIVLCPPAILIDYCDELLLGGELEILESKGNNIEELEESQIDKLATDIRKVHLGGQDCGYDEKGAFTGDIAANMLHDAGCKYVILGHSERRKNHFESDEIVQKKIVTALKNKLVPILCIGESLELREENKYLDFIKSQILSSIPKNIEIEQLIIAYEPIWSIGTGKIPSKDQISEMADFIVGEIKNNKDLKINGLRILYGGSTNSQNTAEIMSVNNVSGMLVGGASLKAKEFAQMAVLAK